SSVDHSHKAGHVTRVVGVDQSVGSPQPREAASWTELLIGTHLDGLNVASGPLLADSLDGTSFRTGNGLVLNPSYFAGVGRDNSPRTGHNACTSLGRHFSFDQLNGAARSDHARSDLKFS